MHNQNSITFDKNSLNFTFMRPKSGSKQSILTWSLFLPIKGSYCQANQNSFLTGLLGCLGSLNWLGLVGVATLRWLVHVDGSLRLQRAVVEWSFDEKSGYGPILFRSLWLLNDDEIRMINAWPDMSHGLTQSSCDSPVFLFLCTKIQLCSRHSTRHIL